jgi:chromosome partitioning protein
MPTKVIAIANQKGGVGKTTTAVNVGERLAASGKAVAVLDLDPQAHATKILGLDPYSVPANIYQVLTDPDNYPITAALLSTRYGVWCIPAHLDLAMGERLIEGMMSRETLLRRRLRGLPRSLDLVLIDCPPSLGALTVNALTAADAVLVPLQCELLALEGLRDLQNTMKEVRDNTNPDLDQARILLTMHDKRAATCRDVTARIRESYGDRVLGPVVGRYRELVKMLDKGPIAQYAPGHEATAEYTAVAEEVARYVATLEA